MTSTATSPSLSVPAQFALIIDGLMKAVAARHVEYPWFGVMIVYVWNRLNRINQRFQRLAALIAAGRLPRPRTDAPRAPMPPQHPSTRRRAPPFGVPWLLGTHRFGWLCRAMPSRPFLPGAGVFAEPLSRLLLNPEMAALLAATPRMGELLRPLFWMLKIDPKQWRPLPPAAPLAVPNGEVVARSLDEAVPPVSPPTVFVGGTSWLGMAFANGGARRAGTHVAPAEGHEFFSRT